ncbi:hypothetical protein F511_36071 [Dorcoceras hygrometricum]|uniref:Uncharacterized protein n=1 Tax=Dorcoceras hygrometricum TaxID=472368 RepID=A0A2Z7B841_9LAMI|nr:hypothetical protein F511_36071 [Dorcoceras hygrometricum]
MLNTLSSVSVRESRIQYLCDPQWFRDMASRGPTTIVAPESQFQTCPTDHAQEAVPIQMIAPTSAVPAEQPPVHKRRAPKRKFRMPEVSDDEIVDKKADVKNVVEKQSDEPFADVVVKEPAMEIIAEKEAETSVDDVDSIIQQILVDTAQLKTDVGEPGITDAEEQVGLRTDTIPEIGETVVDGTLVGEQMVQRSDETENRTDISFAEFTALDFQVFTSETDRMFETGTAYLVEEPIEETEQNQGTEIADAVPTADAKISDDESMTLEEHLSTIPNGSSLPSTTGEVTKIQFGKSITIRGVDEGNWYKTSLPKIPAAEQVIDEVYRCFNSFGFKKLAALKLEEIFSKEELVLTWAENDSTKVALQRRTYILLKYRELLLRKFLEARQSNFDPVVSSSATDQKVLDMLSNLHIFVVEDLKMEMQARGLKWEKTCCSKIFEGKNRDRGVVIARSNPNIKYSCWIRTMIRVNGSWVVEPCADYWKPLSKPARVIAVAWNGDWHLSSDFSSDLAFKCFQQLEFCIQTSPVDSTRSLFGFSARVCWRVSLQ